MWKAFALVLFAVAMPAAALAQSFQTAAPYAILLDAETGTILLERNADEQVAPASMAKVMTAEVVFREITQGRLSLDDEMVVSENAWRRGGAPSGGSTMFAALNSRIKVSDLLMGLIVQSGNDAAIVLAEGIAGNEPSFARRMTDRAREIGLKKAVFMNASGQGDPLQKASVRELAQLSLHVIRTYPELYKMFGQREFTWNRIRQTNRNPLLTMEIGADGLKTGNIDESGFGLIGSAVQGDQRLIVVVNGLKTARDRANEARKLLEWGFRAFETRELFPAGDVIAEASVFGGENGRVGLVAKGAVRVLVPRGAREKITARVVYQGPLRPPVRAGDQVARLRIQRDDVQALDIPLFAAADENIGPLTRRAWDAAVEAGGGWFRRTFSRVTGAGP
jgi:D-alanyl-D-alanine carboxypeptidase (penicillin-binding protein 5/6)